MSAVKGMRSVTPVDFGVALNFASLHDVVGVAVGQPEASARGVTRKLHVTQKINGQLMRTEITLFAAEARSLLMEGVVS